MRTKLTQPLIPSGNLTTEKFIDFPGLSLLLPDFASSRRPDARVRTANTWLFCLGI
jgi:hypothetical protein